MQRLDTKIQILEESGYSYSFDRQIYINRRTKKAFSVEFVEDHSEEELLRCINEDAPGGEWRFYFNSEPSAAVKHELVGVLG